MRQTLALVSVFALVLLSGLAHGLWTNRWATTAGPEAGAARLESLPMTLGEWDGQAQEMNPRELALAEVSGYVKRQYVNRRTGSVVSLLMVCGRPGPVAVHSPSVCYAGAGYEPVGATAKHAEPGTPPDEFWVSQFRKAEAAVPVNLRLWYAWNATGTWQAADNPRVTFARYPILYKMYVVRELPRADEPLEEDPSVDFLRLLLPEIQKASLFRA
jgi:hypothetical protein